MLIDPPRDAAPDFAAAIRASRRAMVVSDPRLPDNPVVFANAAFERLTGYAADRIVGHNCRFLRGPDTDGAATARLASAIAAGEGLSVDLLNYRADGTPFWNALAIDPVRAADGALVGFVGTMDDATEAHHARAALEAEIERRTSELQAALDQQTALLHEVDHRVKNNLQVISSLVLLKARRISDAGARAVLNSMAERIAALSSVHRLLYAVGDASRFDLHAFAEDFVADLKATTDPKRITIELDVEPIAVSAAKAAPLALLVHELATNAVRHAFPADRRGHVAISARRREDEVALAVADDGIGLDAGPPNPDGFGRSLVDMVVRQMRGRLAFEDAGPGTRALVAIPLDAREIGP